MKDIPKHYRLEKVPRPKPSEQGECEEWEPKGASAFWVAEIGDELVGSIALGKSLFILAGCLPLASQVTIYGLVLTILYRSKGCRTVWRRGRITTHDRLCEVPPTRNREQTPRTAGRSRKKAWVKGDILVYNAVPESCHCVVREGGFQICGGCASDGSSESLDVQVRFVKSFILRTVRYASFDAFHHDHQIWKLLQSLENGQTL